MYGSSLPFFLCFFHHYLTSTLLLSSAPLFSPLLCFFLFSLFHLLLLLNLPPLLSLSLSYSTTLLTGKFWRSFSILTWPQ